MKWLKRLLLAVACLLVVLLLGAGVALKMLRGRPEWYAEQHVDAAVQQAAAARAEDEVKRTIDWAAAQQAEERRLGTSSPTTTRTTTTNPAARDRALTVRFTEQELNATFAKWESVYHWDRQYGPFFSNPRIVLYNGRLIVAGVVKSMESVVSLHFEPRVEPDGRLRLDLVRVLGGNLPLPQSMFDGYRQRIEQKVRSALPALQQGARIAPDGAANDKAVAAAMGKFLLRILAGEPDEAVLFLQANQGTRVPVKLTDLRIDGKSISATVEPMTAPERAALLDRIRAPEPSAAAVPAE